MKRVRALSEVWNGIWATQSIKRLAEINTGNNRKRGLSFGRVPYHSCSYFVMICHEYSHAREAEQIGEVRWNGKDRTECLMEILPGMGSTACLS